MRHAILLAVVVAGCARIVPPHASTLDAERGNVQLAELKQGRALLVRKCGSCHQAPMPVQHTAIAWPKLLDEMAIRSNLDAEQRRLILQYLVVMTDAPRPAT